MAIFWDVTRMLFIQKSSICMTNISQNYFKQADILSFEGHMALTLNDLQMTSTFDEDLIEYKHVVELWNYGILLIWTWL